MEQSRNRVPPDWISQMKRCLVARVRVALGGRNGADRTDCCRILAADQQFGHCYRAHCDHLRQTGRQHHSRHSFLHHQHHHLHSSMSTNFQRQIGLVSGICFVVGIIIGSGIFISPKGVFVNANCSQTGAILIWVLCGLYSGLGAIVYSELGTTIVRSGGDYAYLQAGFGSFISFLYLWLNLVVIRPASQCILALTSAYYLLGPFKSHCDSWNYEAMSRFISALLIALLSYVNCVNVKWAIKLQNIFTVLKVGALAIIIVSGIGSYALGTIPVIESNIDQDWRASECHARYSLSIYSGLFAFGGWNYLNIVTEELKNPYKNLPRAALFGILVSTIFYVLANCAYFVVLRPDEILNSPAIALTFASKLIGPLGLLPISLAISASAIGSLNATIFTTSRLFCMGAQEKHLPAVIGMLHHTHCTPIVSLILSVLLTLVMLLANDIYSLINYFSFTYWLWTGITVTSGIYLRYQSPNLDRPIKLPLIVLYLFVLLCLLLTMLAVQNDLLNSLIGLALVLLGMPVYWIKQLTESRMKTCFGLEHLNQFMQKTFLIVEAEEEKREDKVNGLEIE